MPVLPLRELANFLADFGELAAIAPAAVALGAGAAWGGRKDLARAWLGSLALAWGAAAVLKAAGLPMSGHAAVAASFEGGLAVLLWRGFLPGGLAARAAATGLVVVAAAICWSVWALGWHDGEDVAAGALAGALVPARLALLGRAGAAAPIGGRALAAVALLVFALHGVRIEEHAPYRLTWNGVLYPRRSAIQSAMSQALRMPASSSKPNPPASTPSPAPAPKPWSTAPVATAA
jgi:hypothetical protein